MKTKIISMALAVTLLFSTTVFANTNETYMSKNSQSNEQIITNNGIRYTITEDESNVIVKGSNNENTVVNKTTGEIVTELNGVVTNSNVNDYITEINNDANNYVAESKLQSSPEIRSMAMALSSNYQYGNEFTDDYLYQDWFQDGYRYLEGHHSRDYNKNGFLFKQDGQVKKYEGKKLSFSYGTAFGVVAGAIATVASGGTAPAVLGGLGITAAGVLIDYLTISVWLEDDTFLYRVRDDNGKILLDTHQVERYVLGYNHNTGVSTKKFDRMYGGFAGTTSDMIEAGLSLHY